MTDPNVLPADTPPSHALPGQSIHLPEPNPVAAPDFASAPPAQRPSVGRIVILKGSAAESNSALECPAIITRVWTDTMVNVTAFPDFGLPISIGSVNHESKCANPSGAHWAWPVIAR